jgi:hypothetical protein
MPEETNKGKRAMKKSAAPRERAVKMATAVTTEMRLSLLTSVG